MSKFLVVQEAPEKIQEGEYLIDKPSFLDEIRLHSTKKPKNGLTGNFYIRAVVDSIAQKYDPNSMTAYSIKSHKYEGLPFNSDEEFDSIIVNALKQDYPEVFPKYLEYKIRNRPRKTERIIYVDSSIKNQYEIFFQNGFSEEKQEKPKKEASGKVVGKPAITKEQAEALKNQADS